MKTRSSNSRKIDIFPNRLTHGFGPEMAVFPTFLGGQNKAEKCFLRYWTKNCLSRVEEQEDLNSKNWRFWKGVSPWYWSKNGHFWDFFFLGDMGQEYVCYDILERKMSF